MASPFASMTVSEPIPLPFDEGQWVRVRKLTGREHERAQEAHRDSFVSGSARAWSAVFRRALQQGATDPEVLKALRDPLTGYDRHALVRFGLVEWSYPQSLKPIAAVAATDTTTAVAGYDAIEDLADEWLEFVALEVLKRTKPSLFVATVEAAEGARKNG